MWLCVLCVSACVRSSTSGLQIMSTFDSELYHHEKAVKNINYIYPSTSKQWRGTRGHLLWSNGDACSWGWHWHLIRWIKWCESDSFFLPWIRSTKQLLGLLHTHVEIVVIMILVAVRGVRVARFPHTRSWIENLICNSPRAHKWVAEYCRSGALHV